MEYGLILGMEKKSWTVAISSPEFNVFKMIWPTWSAWNGLMIILLTWGTLNVLLPFESIFYNIDVYM